MNMSTKRDSASINSGDDLKCQKINNDDAASIKHETGMEDVLHQNMLPSIAVYLPPRDLLNCLQTNKRWKEEIDTDYVWTDILLPSLALHLPPRDISTCIQASKKWKDKIDTVDTFWKQVVTTTVPPKVVDAIEEMASKLSFLSGATRTINYNSIAFAFDLKENKTIKEIGGILLSSLDDSRKKHRSLTVIKFLSSETAYEMRPFLSENPHSMAEHGIIFTTISKNNSLKALAEIGRFPNLLEINTYFLERNFVAWK